MKKLFNLWGVTQYTFKLSLKMKLTVFLTIVSLLQIHANSYSQSKKITLDMGNVTVTEVLNEIESVSEFKFLFNRKDVDLDRHVSIKVTKKPITTILNELFSGTDVGFEVLNKQIILRKSINKTVPNNTIDFSDINLKPQQFSVSGSVTDNQGLPLSGANIVEKGTTNGVTADFDGNFSINLTNGNATLVVSYIGFATKEIPVNGQAVINVQLVESAAALDEIVVIGYGTQRKQDVTGSVSSINAKDYEDEPTVRIDQAIQGRAAGVQVENADSSPGGNVQIRIRGGNSVFGNNDPLIVIDGFIGGTLENLSPNDIATIDILKDASATAIYGSRGANGVILVTTKGGKGKGKIEFNTFLTSQEVLRKVDVLNAEEYAMAANDYLNNIGLPNAFSTSDIQGFAQNGGTDWQDEIFRNAILKNYYLSASGSGEDMAYYVSGSFFDQQGIIKNTDLKRFTLRTNVRGDIGKRLSFGVNTYFSRNNGNLTEIGNLAETVPTTAALQWSPTLPIWRADGSFTEAKDLPGQTKSPNPYATATEPSREKIVDEYNFNAYLEYGLTNDLKLRTNIGGLFVRFNSNQYFPRTTWQGSPAGLGSISNSSQTRLLNTNTLTYTKVINKHSITLTGIAEFQKDRSSASQQSSAGFITDALTFNNFALASNQLPSTSSKLERTIDSYAARGQYSFDDRYILSASYRIDGSSVLAEGNKYQGFASAAGAWILSNEEFLSQNRVISNLKLRAGWGTSGSQSVPPNSSVAILRSGVGYPFNGSDIVVGLAPYTIGNPNLTWEKTSQLNIGLDLGLFSDRLNLVLDLYNKITTDLLIEKQLPLFSSFAPILSNQGEIGNKGIDLFISADVIKNENFIWSTDIVFSKNTNEVRNLGEGDIEVINIGGAGVTGGGSNFYQLRIGEPLGAMYGYVYDGVWKSNEATEASTFGSAVGGRKYKDINGDGIINTKDITKIGSALPDFTYGWNNSISFRNLSLNLFFQGSQGNDIFNRVRVRSDQSNSDGFGAGGRIRDRFVPGINEDTNVAALGVSGQALNQSSEFVEDGSYFRLKNVTLGYSLPNSTLEKFNIRNLKVYVSGQNLWTVDNYSGYDPEVSTTVSNAANSDNSFIQNTNLGMDAGTYPSSRSFTVGIDFGF